jgi:UDP-N-acetylmuramyl pentapeptide phosphotransferase/UDP-N-acetylglucosamine-1-phosphate transferase
VWAGSSRSRRGCRRRRVRGRAYATLLVAIAALFAVSLVDDYRGVPAAWRMAVQVACALAARRRARARRRRPMS